ncbi:MAG: hypothetical protein EOO17_02125 [Chloroflexi bacterium]|nr:MAG: hypothetical protein EOO17_02125 [Chloroflexota bacterium]
MAKPKAAPEQEIDATEKDWDVATMLAGAGLIIVGVVFLLGSFGVVDVHLGNILQLWPLVVIGAGLSVLKLTGLWRKLVTGVFVALTLILVVISLTQQHGVFGDRQTDTREATSNSTVNRQNNSVDALALNINTAAMKVNLERHTGRQLATAKLSGSDRFRLVQDTSVSGTTQETTLRTEGSGVGWWGLRETNLAIAVSDAVPLRLRLDSGATSFAGDMSELKLTDFLIKTGASEVDAKLGTKENVVKVTVDAGATSVTLRIPRASGVRVEQNGGLTGTDLEDVPKVGDDLYESANYSQAAKKVIIISDSGASSIKVVRY